MPYGHPTKMPWKSRNWTWSGRDPSPQNKQQCPGPMAAIDEGDKYQYSKPLLGLGIRLTKPSFATTERGGTTQGIMFFWFNPSW